MKLIIGTTGLLMAISGSALIATHVYIGLVLSCVGIMLNAYALVYLTKLKQ